MCGLAGFLSKHVRYSPEQIKAATASLSHRGEEEEAYWQNENGSLSFGHKRLCIIDPDKRSSQPYHYLDRFVILHNGELYNYLELKKELQKRGYHFTTTSDTEVIVAAYAAFGSECVKQFDGMFAFAIWDKQEQILFAARDRFGEKPFFFFYNEEEFLFGSEMKALWSAGVPKEVNNQMLYNYLTIGYTSNPFNPQETFYQHIYKLPAASFLRYSLPGHTLSIEKYWIIDAVVNHAISEADAIEQFQSLLSASVHKRLRSDVAIGTSLSGGLDSSAIVALCDKLKADQYSHKCFTAVFRNFDKNEEAQAKLVSGQLNLEQHLVNISDEDLLEEMDKLMWHQEEPVGSTSVLAQYKVYEAAKKNGITVLLDGQGADELLGGYHKYYKWYWQELYANKQLQKSGEFTAARNLGIQERFSWKNKATALFPHFAMAMLQSSKTKKAFKQPDLQAEFAFSNKQSLYYATPIDSTLNSALYFNTFTYGLEELLRYADRNSMAHAVEVRLPFLSHQLAEFLFTLPPKFKINNGWAKWILRKASESLLPSSIVWRKDKTGFEPPQKQWMQNKSVQEQITGAKKLLVERSILNPTVLKKPVIPTDAYAANNNDWRYWLASYLFR